MKNAEAALYRKSDTEREVGERGPPCMGGGGSAHPVAMGLQRVPGMEDQEEALGDSRGCTVYAAGQPHALGVVQDARRTPRGPNHEYLREEGTDSLESLHRMPMRYW